MKLWLRVRSLTWQSPAVGVVLGVPLGMSLLAAIGGNVDATVGLISGGIALFIAMWSESVRRAEARQRSVLTAARMEPVFLDTKNRLESLREILTGRWQGYDPAQVSTFRAALTDFELGYDLEDLIDLSRLPGEPAMHALRTLREFEKLKRSALRFGSPDHMPDTDRGRQQIINGWVDLIESGMAGLDYASAACLRSLPSLLAARVFY